MSKAVGGAVYGMEEVDTTSVKTGKLTSTPTKTMIGFEFTGSIKPENWNKLEALLQKFFDDNGCTNVSVNKIRSKPTKP